MAGQAERSGLHDPLHGCAGLGMGGGTLSFGLLYGQGIAQRGAAFAAASHEKASFSVGNGHALYGALPAVGAGFMEYPHRGMFRYPAA